MKTYAFVGLVWALAMLSLPAARAETSDLSGGFIDHGVASPISNHRGTVATVDGQGRNVVLLWLYDHRGGYALLDIDVESGRSRQVPMPAPTGGDGPFASLLSRDNKFYTHFGSHFFQFDPVQAAFTFHHRSQPQMAMSMTEDDRGVIWSATYPNSGLVSFDPATGQFRDYGSLHKANWAQYPRGLAADDAGWIYLGIGTAACQIVAFDPATTASRAILPDVECKIGAPALYRDLDGKVYGCPAERDDGWYELYRGEARRIGMHPKRRPKPVITSSQGLFHTAFPDGSTLKQCDLVQHTLVVQNKDHQAHTARFEYTSEGAVLMGAAAAPDGTICGGTAFPMRFFSYHPGADRWDNHPCYGQCNTVASQGERFFVGGYGHGFLLEWDPARPWVDTAEKNPASNPRLLTQCHPTINRPHKLLACPDGQTLVLAGTPGYGYTGGGLLFWDRRTGQGTLVDHEHLIPQHSTMSLVALEGGKLLGGTTTSAGTGGEKKAAVAELYLLDPATRQIDWHQPVLPGVQGYTDLCLGPRGLVFGFADGQRLFVFDPAARKIVHEQAVDAEFGRTVSQQGPRVFVRGPGGEFFVLFSKRIARLDPQTYTLSTVAVAPLAITAGGDYLEGRIWFASGSHLCSYRLPNGTGP